VRVRHEAPSSGLAAAHASPNLNACEGKACSAVKRGTAVRNIGLVADNPAQIEGRVNDQRIVILTEFVKKA